MRDERLADLAREHGGRRARMGAHHQLTPPSSASPISSSAIENVPAERYFQPPSGSSATIVPWSISFATRAAATITAPQDGPAKIPSRKTSSRSAAIESSFETRYFASMQVRLEDLRDEALVERAQALDLLAGQRLDRDDPDARLLLAEVARDAHQRPGGAEAGDEHVDLGAVREDLRAGRLVVGQRVGRVPVLVRHHEPLVLGHEVLGQRDRPVRAQRPGESMTSAPYSAAIWRRSLVTLSGITSATR